MNRSKNNVDQPRWCKECKNCAYVHKQHSIKKDCTVPDVHIPFMGIAALCNSDKKKKK